MSKFVITLFSFYCVSLFATQPQFLETPKGGDFSIATSLSKSFNLADLRGKTTFLYFGFTKCPQVCPLTTQRLIKLRNELSKKNISDVHFLFISVDNERDTLASLSKYATSKGNLFSAGITSDDKLREILSLYGGHFSRIKNAAKQTIIDQSSNVYVISPAGEWVETLRYNQPYEAYLKAYQHSKKPSQKELEIIAELRAKREIHSLGSNQKCDLSKTQCSLTLPDKTYFNISFSPTPIKTEKKFSIQVQTSSKTYFPSEVDFVGIDLNMGYIRPKLQKSEPLKYTASLELPICELRKMKWRVRLLLKDAASTNYYIDFFLETLD
jgi:protein SCO1/2